MFITLTRLCVAACWLPTQPCPCSNVMVTLTKQKFEHPASILLKSFVCTTQAYSHSAQVAIALTVMGSSSRPLWPWGFDRQFSVCPRHHSLLLGCSALPAKTPSFHPRCLTTHSEPFHPCPSPHRSPEERKTGSWLADAICCFMQHINHICREYYKKVLCGTTWKSDIFHKRVNTI